MKKVVQKLAKEKVIVPIVIIGGYIALGIFFWTIGDRAAVAIMTMFGVLLAGISGAVVLEERCSEI